MTRRSLFNLFAFAIIIASAWFLLLKPRIQEKPLPLTAFSGVTLIAHGGGGLQVGMYSNSKQALEQSVSKGFKYVEVDFSLTSTGDLVLIHDWDLRFQQYFGAKNRPQSATQFKALKMRDGLTQMDLADLLTFLEENPDIRIITDIKQQNLKSLEVIAGSGQGIQTRFIPQIYALPEYEKAKALGFNDIIFTNYKAKRPYSEIMEFAKSNKLFGLTMPYEAVTDEIIAQANAADLPVFVHKFLRSTPLADLNSVAGATDIKNRGISGIYTDYLHPAPTTPSGGASP